MSDGRQKPSVLDKVIERQGQADDGTWRLYVQLITDDVADDQQLEQLGRLMFLLNKSREDLEADRKVLEQAKQHQLAISGNRDLDPEIQRSGGGLEEMQQRHAEQRRQMDAELSELAGRRSALIERRAIAQKACAELKELKLRHEKLLQDMANVDPATV